MSKKVLFDEDSDEELVSLKTENEYAKKYDNWREKEELHKLEQKYGPNSLNPDASSSDSEDESDESLEVSEETEQQFLKTLSLLKTKDPRIYDPQYQFFDKEKKEEEKKPKAKELSFADSDDEDDDGGDIFKVEKVAVEPADKLKTKDGKISNVNNEEKSSKRGKIKEYLTGKVDHVDEEVEQDLAPLKALWSDPKLNEGEAFLRDYILNKRYLEEGEAVPLEKVRDDEELEEDEKRVEEQGQFERAYNFRFEEPDAEFLKRFPRTMNFIRPKDDRRARKRAEIRERKEEEKRRKMEEIGRMKALKLKEIQEKIAKIKEVTGNDELGFKDEDIEGDFDPAEHDRRMRRIFDEQYYGVHDDTKPEFPDLDQELEIENWDNFEPDAERQVPDDAEEPHCEDEGFNMDADFDPKKAKANLIEELVLSQGKKRRNRKNKSKLASLLATEKPKYIPSEADKTYDEYMEEYYKMDCEDVIGGDLPTRFKYREVVPNDFGLTIDEILLADDKELTQWVPLKKIVKHRPTNIEQSEVNTYRLKAQDINLKKKMLPSLFKELPQEPEIVVPVETKTKKKKKKKNKIKDNTVENPDESHNNEANDQAARVENGDNNTDSQETEQTTPKKQKKKKNKSKNRTVEPDNTHNNEPNDNASIVENGITNTDDVKSSEELKHKKKSKAKKSENQLLKNLDNSENNDEEEIKNETTIDISINANKSEGKRKKKKQKKSNGFIVEEIDANNHNTSNNVLEVKSSELNVTNKKNKHENKGKLKRKLDGKEENVASKKKKHNKEDGRSKKDFKIKNKKDKERVKKQDSASDNPLSKLSDERLKAYGLNPKKYRGFLKYKKF